MKPTAPQRKRRTAPTLDRLEGWEWHRAEQLYRIGEPDSLAKLVRSRKAIPSAQRAFLADFVGGNMATPPMRGKANARLTHEQRAEINDKLRSEREFHAWVRTNVATVADKYGIEIAQVLARLAVEREGVIAALAARYRVTAATIEKVPQRFTALPIFAATGRVKGQ